MNLLQSGVPLEIIRDFLGHVDVKTTEIYARANLEMRQKALAKVADIAPKKPKDHLMVLNLSGRGDKDLASVAEHLGTKI